MKGRMELIAVLLAYYMYITLAPERFGCYRVTPPHSFVSKILLKWCLNTEDAGDSVVRVHSDILI